MLKYALINQQNLCYQDTGGNQPALLFMHGFLMNQNMFAEQVKALKAHYRIISFDLRGFGETQWDGKPFSLNDLVDDALGLLHHLNIKNAVITGMSMGGYIALRLALKSPEMVRALILMSTRADNDNIEQQRNYIDMRDTWHQQGALPPMLTGLMDVIIGQTKAAREYWEPIWADYPGEAIYHSMNAMLEREEIEHKISSILAPALVLHGSDDLGIPISQARTLAGLLPNCNGMVEVNGAAHAPNITHAEEVNRAITAFLNHVSEPEQEHASLTKAH